MGLKGLLKKNRLTYLAARTLRRMPYPLYTGWMRLCHALKGVESGKVYFSSFNGKAFDDNPKYICKAVHEQYPELRLVFCLSGAAIANHAYPDYVIPVKRNTPRALKEMATARVIVDNAQFRPYMVKFSDQYYIQTWHGDRGFKRIALDLDPSKTKTHLEWKYMDLGMSGSEFGTDYNMRKALGFRGEVLEHGCPRNDILVQNPAETAAAVRTALGIGPDTHVLLYAPTFRDSSTGSSQSANFSLKKLRAALETATGQKWMILLRGHSLNSGVNSDEGVDVSKWSDVSELLLACDMLVTDYSSIVGDFFLLDRPLILYHADRTSFTDSEREMIYDPEKTPYRIAHNEAELLSLACEAFDAKENCDALRRFYHTFESGHSAQLAAERIHDVINTASGRMKT